MSEVLLAQFLVQLVVIVAQIAVVLLVAFPLFRNQMVGPVLPLVLLCVAQGTCGMWYGKHPGYESSINVTCHPSQ